MRYFCPKCWSDFAKDLPSCPECGQDIVAFWAGRGYVGKLILALEHPEPETRIRAPWILGMRGEKRAAAALVNLVETTQDVYGACAGVEAMARIGTSAAIRAVRDAAMPHPAAIVREAAQDALAAALNRPAGALL